MSEVSVKRSNTEDADFRALVQQLDADLAVRDGMDHSFYAQYNKLDAIRHVVVLYLDDQPVSCGAIKEFDTQTSEVKRMFTLPAYRSRGLGAMVLQQLEKWALELGKTRLVLETGLKQPEAIRLYQKAGFSRINNYGQYVGVANSVCFEKSLTASTPVKDVIAANKHLY